MKLSLPLPVASSFSILIVDDDPGAIQLIRRALSDHTDVRFAMNGTDAFRVIRERAPDLILLDGDMPGESGFEVCRRLKADSELRDIPVIFITAHNDLEFETRALTLGAADFIPKPVSAPRVQLRVRLHLLLKEQVDQLRVLAATDALTGLANRRALDAALKREWARACRADHALSLVMVDVDFFKLFNDSYGHPAGDACLKMVASAVARAARRPTDLAGRFGGEEFALILPDTPAKGALQVAHQLREAVAELTIPHRESSVAPYVTVSVGVSCVDHVREHAVTPSSSDTREARDLPLVAAADHALYSAKHRGRNRVELCALSEQSFAQARPR